MPLVTYVPQENGDPIEMMCCGVKFRNGEPVDIAPDLTVEILTVEKALHEASGDIRSRAVEKKVPVIDILKRNPYFRIEGEEPPPSRKAGGRPKTPHTPDEYKSFAMGWFQRAESHTDLAARWEAEAELREKCGVHDDGEVVSYLRQFFDGRFMQLKKAAA